MASPSALALDAADGVIDGRHFGRPIVQAGAQPAFFGGQPAVFGAQPVFGAQTFAPTTVLGGYPSFGGFAAQPTVFGGANAAALALDAADGVIDGKSFGRPIVQAGAQPAFFGGQSFVQGQPAFFGAQPSFVQAQPTFVQGYPQTFAQPAFGQFGGANAAALALDAADGVIDGKSFGRPIVQAGAQPAFFGGQSFVQAQPTFVQAQPSFVQGYPQAFAQPAFAQPAFGGANAAALALDAADGVIDGKSFGRPIVQAGGLVPYTGVAAAPQFAGYQGVPTFAAAPQVAFQGAVPSQFYGQRFAGYPGAAQYGGVPVAGYGGAYPAYGNTYAQAPVGRFAQGSAAQRAAALDAADGVIDGRHFGRPIVQQRRR